MKKIERIDEWMDTADLWISRLEYDFSMCESMQMCLEEAREIIKEFQLNEKVMEDMAYDLYQLEKERYSGVSNPVKEIIEEFKKNASRNKND